MVVAFALLLAPTAKAVGAERPWRPVPWRAAILNLFFPGLGQLYNGKPLRAALTYLAFRAWPVVYMMLSFALSRAPLRMLAVALGLVGGWTFCIADALSIARRTPSATRREFQRWYVLTGIAIALVFVVTPRFTEFVRTRVVETLAISSRSMEPTILQGDLMYVSKDVGAPRRGDLLVLSANSNTEMLVQRLVGLPGDTLAMRGQQLVVNGHVVKEPYVIISDSLDLAGDWYAWQRRYLVPGSDTLHYRASAGTWGPLIVPADRYFFLGDHRNKSRDSRDRGFTSGAELLGRPRWIYFSGDESAAKIRWSRMGKSIASYALSIE